MPNTDNVIHKGTAEILVNNQKLCFSTSFGRITNYIVWIIHVIIITFNYKSNQNVNWDKGFCTIRNSYMYLFHLVKSLLSIMQTTRSWKKVLTSTFTLLYYHAKTWNRACQCILCFDWFDRFFKICWYLSYLYPR